MIGLTLEDLVLFKTLLKAQVGDAEPLNGAEKRHYIHGSGIFQRLNEIGFDVHAYELSDMEKLKESSRNEVKVKKV
ncbi:conserved hypothetical protein [Vibrio phage 501E54-1]|nr:conserved hypothetical protein [Vibrio phage 501E54-1]